MKDSQIANRLIVYTSITMSDKEDTNKENTPVPLMVLTHESSKFDTQKNFT